MATALTRRQRQLLNQGARSATATFQRGRATIGQFGGQAAAAVQRAVRGRMTPQQIRADYQTGMARGASGTAGRAYRAAFRSYGVTIPTEA